MIQYNKGDKFGELTIIQEDFHEKEVTGYQKYRKFVVECFCGKKFITRISGLKNGRVMSCGCRGKDGFLLRITRHNLSTSSEYTSWESMKSRCLNTHNKFYYNYGGRGINVCKRWLDFKNFYKDMGNKPDSSFSLERIDVNGNYCLENCRWANRFDQDRNRRNSVRFNYQGKEMILTDISRMSGVHQQTIRARTNIGLSIDDAISKEYKYVKSGKYVKKDVILL